MTQAEAGAGTTGPRIVRAYLSVSALFTLATSLIWGVNTLFLLDAGIDIFQVMVVNAAFSAGQVLFEVPTGVVADTIGRKASFLAGIFTLFVSTLLYLGSAEYQWGIGGFIGASLLLGLGFTFQTGAVDAWLVDALDHVGYEAPRENVFARSGMVFGVAMIVGTLAGGLLGQIDLAVPFLVRAGVLVAAFIATLFMMREIGFEPRPLKASTFLVETRRIARAGLEYGWRDRVVRPLLLLSALQGTFMMYFWYASQPYALDLLGRPDLIWVAGALAALFALANIVGNTFVSRLMKSRWSDRPASVLRFCTGVFSALVVGLGLLGVLTPEGGSIVSFSIMVALFSGFGIAYGVLSPVRQAYINRHIPSAQRATVLSLDSFSDEAGSMLGQPGFGWIAKTASIPVGYLVGSVFMFAAYPLYGRSGKAAAEKLAATPEQTRIEPGDGEPGGGSAA